MKVNACIMDPYIRLEHLANVYDPKRSIKKTMQYINEGKPIFYLFFLYDHCAGSPTFFFAFSIPFGPLYVLKWSGECFFKSLIATYLLHP